MAFQTLSGMCCLPPNILATALRKSLRALSFATSSHRERKRLPTKPTPSVVEATIVRPPSGPSTLAMAFLAPFLKLFSANWTKAEKVLLYPLTSMGMAGVLSNARCAACGSVSPILHETGGEVTKTAPPSRGAGGAARPE